MTYILFQQVKAIRATLPTSDKGVNKNMSLHFKFLKNYLKREVCQFVLPRECIHQIRIYSYVMTQHVSILKYYMCVSFMQEYSASGWEGIRNVVLKHMLRLVTIILTNQ